MGGRYYDQPRSRERRLKEDHDIMLRRRQGVPLKVLAQEYKLSSVRICEAATRVEEVYLAWGFPLPPKTKVHGKDL